MAPVRSLAGALLASLGLVAGLSPAEWRSQSIYQVVTDRFALDNGGNSPSCSGQSELNLYCNGTFAGIIDKLDYIQNMGFTAIWISPVVKNIDGGSPNGYTPDGSAYHGYWAQDIYEINPHFGGASGLTDLSNALHNRGMYLMVDVVVNHMAYYCGTNGGCGPGNSVNYGSFTPFNSESYFHPFCEIDYNNRTSILDCWEGDEIVPLVDLRTEDSDVQSIFNSWISNLIQTYNIDGLRIDSLQQSGSFFFPGFNQAAGGMYMVGEVFNGNPSYVCPYQQAGMPGVLNYPMFFYITNAFQTSSGSMSQLAQGISAMQSDCSDTTLLGSFLENQDNPRFPSQTNDLTRAQNAIAFTMLQDGIPITYYGQEQHLSGSGVPLNREALWTSGGYDSSSPLYKMITTVNQLRTLAIKQNGGFVTYKIQVPYTDSNHIVTRKGNSGYQIVGVYTNVGSAGASSTLSLSSSETGFQASEPVMDVLSCTLYHTGSDGSLSFTMTGGLPRVFYNATALAESSLCTTYTTATPPPGGCSAGTVVFDVYVQTQYGQSVVIAGNIPQLGNWSPANGLNLNANQYTASSPKWTGTITGVAPGTTFQWKPIVVTNGNDNWYTGSNQQATTGSACSSPATDIEFTWSS
uniref:alpha-amylase n=1 Tax=Saitozyma flava TaxID=5416 RepID=A7LGW4_SAIFL|nr:alpha-amylase [Saitozyma flava]